MTTLDQLPHERLLENLGNNFITDNDQKILDLVDVISTIYIRDIQTKRRDSWSRKFEVSVPVTNVSLWEQARPILSRLITFVSGDQVEITYTQREKEFRTGLFTDLTKGNFKAVSLLSGGLDSFSGAYHNIANGIPSLYNGYQNSNNSEHKRQKLVSEFICLQDPSAASKISPNLKVTKIEPTQATRSLLFLALACALAYSYQIKDVFIYENGVLSLNPVINHRFTTKTTHPRTISLYNQLLKVLELDIMISNPFLFETKGAIIDRLSNTFKVAITNTYTCSRSRQNIYVGKFQCGHCIPCILRKISLAAYDNEHYDVEYDVPYDYKLRSIKDKYVQNEYKSSVDYFRELKGNIDNGSIYSYIDIRPRDYETGDYNERTTIMLKEFSREFERFWSKYAIY
ncbi:MULTISPECIES: 7-cyano-7-deazaguanine synthase [unclassified Brevibacillus]|uniref:7-cyano-7-deazaguanine synthase n=1 Tax=unclassified Brevibacillus TaxID=2684853 RepID=UPI0006F5036B|nr:MULTISPECIES: 7-cyano-7-deazaguanine synthase [unclassified Brevibacillus]TQK74927.1 7-cyano-7-deazaguanine synthase in queuosine biosynthesis [Brevibacillus sp. AG162]